jgi:hypothetical protein
MKALAAYVHSKGLKIGIYSSPGPQVCGGYQGSYGHEEEDAQTFADWGYDYLKYDWCSAFSIYQPTRADLEGAYQKMGEALAEDPGRSSLALANMASEIYGSGELRRAPIFGEPLSTSLTIGSRWKKSGLPSSISRSFPNPVTGTIPTCSKSAMAA